LDADYLALSDPFLSIFLLLIRVCLATVYLVSGIHKAIWFSKALNEFRMAGVSGTWAPLAVLVTVVLHVSGALCLLSGIYAREAAAALCLFTIVATIQVHDFWKLTGQDRLMQSRIALEHLAIVGGLALFVVVGPGKLVF
jgi:transmembrane protein